jgi:hypothetical protein
MKRDLEDRRKKVFEIISRNRDVFNSLITQVLSGKPKYMKNFIEKKDKMYELIDQFPEIIDTLENVPFPIIEDWLLRAEKDLKSSTRNFKARDVEKSVYDLQQSLEKLAKSYALYFGIYKENDLIKVSHSPIRIYIKLLESGWIETTSRFFNLKADPIKGLEFLKKFNKMNPETVKEILRMDKDIPIFLRMYERATRAIKKALNDKETKSVVKEIRDYQNPENFFGVNFDFASLIMPLSVILCVHESPSRYPDKLREYNIVYKDTELVKNYYKIIESVGACTKRFRETIREDKKRQIDWDNVDLEEMEQQIKALKEEI